MPVVVANGVRADCGREVLGLDVGDSEDEVFWRSFLTDLKHRGLTGVRLLISDQHVGLVAALGRLPPRTPVGGSGQPSGSAIRSRCRGAGTAAGAAVRAPSRAAMTSATRRALAMIVSVGFTAVLETKKLESAT